MSEKFKDRNGVFHTIEYHEIVSFSASPFHKQGDMVAVFRKIIFKKFDGAKWMSDELNRKNIPKYVFEDMRKKVFDGNMGKGVKREPIDSNLVNSYVVLCNDGPHQGQFKILAGHNSPVVFNNSCWSWGEIAAFFIAGGARAYVGTFWAVSSSLAKDSAISFYKRTIEEDQPIANVIWDINKGISIAEQENIFMAWCLPFSCLKKCDPDKHFPNFVGDVIYYLDRWIEKIVNTPDSEVKENSEMIVKFLIWVLHKEFGQDVIAEARDTIMEKYGYDLEQNKDVLKYREFPR